MKRNIFSRLILLVLMLIASSACAWGQSEISFDISKGNVILTDATYTGYSSAGTKQSGTHHPANRYIISGTTTAYNVQVGSESQPVTQDFIIYLDGVDIRRKTQFVGAFAVYNQGNSVVAVVLKDGTKNKLYSGKNRAGLEKSGGAACDGTLLLTCEEGYTAWLGNHTHGHTTGVYNASACTDACGHLDARSGNAWDGGSSTTYNCGAGIGTAGKGENGTDAEGVNAGTNALVNLTIAGGNIEARGAWGYSSGTSGGAAAIGTGSALNSDKISGTITGLTITGGNINAYRIDDSAACIGGGYRSGYVTMDIYGGTIDATLKDPLSDNTNQSRDFNKVRAAAIGGGGGGATSASPAGATVTIHNGVIRAEGQYSAAIGSGAGGKSGAGQYAKVTIHNGDIEARTFKGEGAGSGAAIGSGGSTGTGHAGDADIIINGGNIVAYSELGADIGGGGTNSASSSGYGGTGNVTITGGTITAMNGGIGGGRANAGAGGNSTITISGETTHITSPSIGGGRSTKNTGGDVTLTVNEGKLIVADFIGGGVGGASNDKIGCAKVYINGGDISGRILMRASGSKGCIFSMTEGRLTSPIITEPGGAVYMIDPKGVASMTGGAIYSCTGTTGGAVYMSGGTFDLSGGSVTDCSGTIGGGAVYMEGGTFNISGGTISGCEGATGGAVYLNSGTFNISGSAKMQDNLATDGGAVYLAGTGQFNVKGGTIQDNTVSGNGGAFYLTSGTFTMNSGKVTTNQSTNGNGAGIYIANGTVTVSGGEVVGNIAAQKGGGFYVGGGTVELSNGMIASNKATKAGGGICLEGAHVNVNGCTLTENEATAGNGGGLFLSNASMTYNGGILTFNKATGTGSFKTAYCNDGHDIQGVGGGIYISDNSSLTFGDFSQLGVYANVADMAADDVFVNGENTTLVLPNISEMSLDSYAGNAGGLGWYEDYFEGDESYNIANIAKGSHTSFEHRFREAQTMGREYMREYEYQDSELTKTFTNTYVAFALGFLFSDLIIEVDGLKPHENCVVMVQGTAEGGKYHYVVPILGNNGATVQQRITKLPIDLYTVSIVKDWTWAYEDVAPIQKVNNSVYKFALQHKPSSITHDETHVKVTLK